MVRDHRSHGLGPGVEVKSDGPEHLWIVRTEGVIHIPWFHIVPIHLYTFL